MKTFNPTTPSNRHCILTSNQNLF
ncbi:MAG: hypothetical protein K0R94_237, partial [Burkholderiales bacterium]|nr:hypothetical protein [Burkholderiales bacterium]